MMYKAALRGFDLAKIEEIVRFSYERYTDHITGSCVVIGPYENKLVLIPYESRGNSMIPITVHVTSRQQIEFRMKTGRFTHE